MSNTPKHIGIVVGLFLVGFAAVQILAAGDATLETRLCKLGICSTDQIAQRAYQEFLEGEPSRQPLIASDLKRAVLLDPASSFRWSDLGEVLEAQGDNNTAAYCFRRAVELGPHSSPILLRTANFDFQTGATNDALLQLRRILTDSSDYDSVVFSLFDRLSGSPEQVLHSGLPEAKRPAQAYFRHLASRDDYESTQLTWQWLEARGLTDKALGVDWVNFLIRSRRYAEAQTAFDQQGRRDPQPNLLYNGAFESKPGTSDLDWHIAPHPSVSAAIEDGALHIKFPGTENVSYSNVTHKLILGPGSYALEAEMRSDKLTTNEGVWLQLVDVDSPTRLNLRTEPITGTAQRTERLEFTITGEPRLLELRVMRQPSAKFDNKIAGDVWLRNVVIERRKN